MQALSAEHGRRPREIAPEVLERLSRLPWPGNVRELRNIIERLVIMAPGERDRGAAPAGVARRRDGRRARRRTTPPRGVALAADGPLAAAREEFEKRYILRSYHECGGNMSRTAEALGVERSNLYRKMKGVRPAARTARARRELESPRSSLP